MKKMVKLESIIGGGRGETGKYEEPLNIDEEEIWDKIIEITNSYNDNYDGKIEYRYLGHFTVQNITREDRGDGIFLFDWILKVIVEREK